MKNLYKRKGVLLWITTLLGTVAVIASLTSLRHITEDYDEDNGDATLQLAPSGLFVKTRKSKDGTYIVGLGKNYGAYDFNRIFSYPEDFDPSKRGNKQTFFGWNGKGSKNLYIATPVGKPDIDVAKKLGRVNIYHVTYDSFFDQLQGQNEKYSLIGARANFEGDQRLHEKAVTFCKLSIDGATNISNENLSLSYTFDKLSQSFAATYFLLPAYSSALDMSLTGGMIEGLTGEPTSLSQSSALIGYDAPRAKDADKALDRLATGHISIILSFAFGKKIIEIDGLSSDTLPLYNFKQCVNDKLFDSHSVP